MIEYLLYARTAVLGDCMYSIIPKKSTRIDGEFVADNTLKS